MPTSNMQKKKKKNIVLVPNLKLYDTEKYGH